jgi:Tol biopolymer transport system component
MKTDPAARIALADWSHDMIVYTQNDAKTKADIWYMPVTSGKLRGEPVRVLGTDAVESQGQISPDGQWLAYSVSESGSSIGGTSQIYVRALTSDTQVKQVSVDGGVQPRWRPDGRELYFLTVVSGPRKTDGCVRAAGRPQWNALWLIAAVI